MSRNNDESANELAKLHGIIRSIYKLKSEWLPTEIDRRWFSSAARPYGPSYSAREDGLGRRLKRGAAATSSEQRARALDGGEVDLRGLLLGGGLRGRGRGRVQGRGRGRVQGWPRERARQEGLLGLLLLRAQLRLPLALPGLGSGEGLGFGLG